MITISRLQAKVFRDVLRYSLVHLDPEGEFPLMAVRTMPEGTILEAQQQNLAVRWHLPDVRPTAELTFRATVLGSFEGRTDEPVALEQVGPDLCKANWQEKGAAHFIGFEPVPPDSLPPFPAFPGKMFATEPRLLVALGEASRIAARDHVRYALSRIQLRGGKAGQVVATDGRQLYMERGFRFPWSGDVLVCAVPAFARPNLLPAADGRLGRTDTHVVWQFGPWTFALRVDPHARFPEVNHVIPDVGSYNTRLLLDPAEAELLRKAIPKLPGRTNENAPILLDLDDSPAVGVESVDDQPASRIELPRSQVNGKPLRVRCNRQYLLRALDLGFREIRFNTEKTPIVCQDPERLYLCIPLTTGNGEAPVAPTQIAGPTTDPAPTINHSELRRTPDMPDANHPNGNGERLPTAPLTLEDLIAEAEEMRRVVGELGTRLSRWIAALKQQRRHTRVVRQAISSIRQIDLGV